MTILNIFRHFIFVNYDKKKAISQTYYVTLIKTALYHGLDLLII